MPYNKNKHTVLVVAPHADDETLGCGGSLLKHLANGDNVHWLLVTGMSQAAGYSGTQIEKRQAEIQQVHKCYGFNSTTELLFPPARLDLISKGELVAAFSTVLEKIRPDTVYLPYRNDAHSDHQAVFDVTVSATKSFRTPYVKRLLAYETLSETEFGLKPEDGGFRPNLFINITDQIEKKLEILRIFSSEMADFPFPRSYKAVAALASLRGVQCGYDAAEAFMLLKEVIE